MTPVSTHFIRHLLPQALPLACVDGLCNGFEQGWDEYFLVLCEKEECPTVHTSGLTCGY